MVENPNHIRTSQVGRYTMQENTKTDYIKLLPKAQDHKYTLIWIHGLGDTARGFLEDFVNPERKLVPKTCKVVLPTAPIRAVS